MKEGIIVGCDLQQEWLLPWWWERYSRHNNYPVVFFDFGMSKEMISWCQVRGKLIALSESSLGASDSYIYKDLWELLYGKTIWSLRQAWFKKPIALLHAPFEVSLWIDLDCQINGNIGAMFQLLGSEYDIGLAEEPIAFSLSSPKNAIHYNAGVILFRRGALILKQFADVACAGEKEFLGDQDALCFAVAEYKPSLIELDPTYNWVRKRGENDKALIYHHTGPEGKETIKET